jgi:hypothetical protein
MNRQTLLFLVSGLVLLGLVASSALAHQPNFEDQDIVAEMPWQIADPTISTAIYATLDSREDVDYFTFEGTEGAAILLELTIPQIEGQANFAPTMALMGPGLPETALPNRVTSPAGAGALVIEPDPGPARVFNEPFSGTSYWERQEERVALPAGGQYTVAVWHPEGQVGRYTFVIGDREVRGGDPAFATKIDSYWTPVEATVAEPEPKSESIPSPCGL